MKRLLLLLLIIPVIGHAQTWNIAVFGGLGINTVPKAPKANQDDRMLAKPVGGISFSKRIRKFEIGLKGTMFPIVSRYDKVYTNGGLNPSSTTKYNTYYAQVAVGITPFANYYFLKGKNRLYAGLNAGIAPTFQRENINDYDLTNPTQSTRPVISYEGGTAFIGGAQIGYSRMLGKRLSLGLELSPNYFTGKFTLINQGIETKDKISVAYCSGVLKLACDL